MTQSLFKTALILGLLTAIGPFAIDMYVPALPAIGEKLNADVPHVQASLMVFLGAVALCQVFYGPVSDMIGRKPPLYFGLVLFIVASIGAAMAPTIGWLITARIVQGIGACAMMSLPRAIVRDFHTGPEAARLMTLLMLVLSVSPILAPLTGSLIIKAWSWRGVFVFMMLAAVLGIFLLAFALPETRPPEKRVESGISHALASYAMLLRDRRFMGLSFIGGFGISSFFGFIANSSFVYIDHYGLGPTSYALSFSVNAIAFIGMAQTTSYLAQRYGFSRIVATAAAGFCIVAMILFGLFVAGIDGLPVLMVFLFVAFGFLGIIIPSSAVMALDDHGEIAGSASALMGTVQMVTAAIVMAVVSAFFNGTALPMVGGIAACSLVVLALSLAIVRIPSANESVSQAASG
ncbi:multidrug effflux MFS transporter [Pararhizobium mangrovi]|uniref:Bcr/CflA family efflux transporter n=1 Tax=Pararhizobium mangrovi TaxID=2590452 RepID=A0A506UHY7_9HYPH|nr:multidrug effflux MFS transporter [Pararhizobium mangrovi]TPW32919.1 multidrug effflux MFS transporter [Pararhizobium mangrovi]